MSARQEVLNVHIASILSRLGLPSQAERRRQYIPDLIVSHHYLGTILGEAEIGETWDDKSSRDKLITMTNHRFKQRQFAHIDFILLMTYPRELVKQTETEAEDKIEDLLAKGQIGLGIAYRQEALAEMAEVRWYPSSIGVTQVPSILEQMSKDIVGLTPEEATRDLTEAIEQAGKTLSYVREMKEAFLIKASAMDIDPEIFEDKNDCINLTVKTMFTLGGVGLIIYELARTRHPTSLQDLSPLDNVKLLEGLQNLRKINYIEIIDSAISAWSDMPNHAQLNQFLDAIYTQIKRAIRLIRRGGWDVLAFIYQRLLSETYRKAYATFYTKLPAAYLLANLAISSGKEKVIDPACGTGSLLVSGFFSKRKSALRPEKLHDLLAGGIEEPVLDYINKNQLDEIYGLDALETAISLSSGVLTLASMAVPRHRLKLLTAPVGPDRSGSLDLLRAIGIGSDEYGIALRPRKNENFEKAESAFDVVIMNPPFTRSDRIPTLIGDRARRDLGTRNFKFGGIKTENLFVAGLAKPFLVLADRLCKNRGRIAAVLPNSILSREAWADIRQGIVSSYLIDYIVVSYASGTPNFSSDTQFREILLVLKKDSGSRSSHKTKVINLFAKIDELKLHEIDSLTFNIQKGKNTLILPGRGLEISALVQEIDWKTIESVADNWYRLVAFKNLDLTQYHLSLIRNRCVAFGSYFSLGSVVDHTSGLLVGRRTRQRDSQERRYDAVWGSGGNSGVTAMQDTPHHSLLIEDENALVCRVWERDFTGDIMILRRGQLNTQHVLMFQLDRGAVSNVWWPLKISKRIKGEHVKAVIAFMNSVFGVIHILGERLETRGLWMELKKGQLEKMPVPAFGRLPVKKLQSISRRNELSQVFFTPLPEIREYIKEMARLETQNGTYENAIREALKIPHLKPRALIDRACLELLRLLRCKSPPEKIYQLVSDEIETLNNIMESAQPNMTVRDRGTGAIRKASDKSQRKLDTWSG